MAVSCCLGMTSVSHIGISKKTKNQDTCGASRSSKRQAYSFDDIDMWLDTLHACPKACLRLSPTHTRRCEFLLVAESLPAIFFCLSQMGCAFMYPP
mmetsp:Transcript_36924/g.71004  ORF Transcript_36924/g.71004 Transcript_36924/m.71004 type:complete len:96 (-) Transcript_36924:2974-3261(-)